MAFVELTREENPKLAVQVNNSLKYQDKGGNLHDRQKVTAFIDVVKEAGSVAGMDKGSVMLSLNTEGGYKNYFVNKTKQDDIMLIPTDKELQKDKSTHIYFNKHEDRENKGKYFYSLSKSNNSEQLLDSIKTIEIDRSAYLGARVTLSNKELLQNMMKFENETGDKSVAILGKDTLRVEKLSDLLSKSKTTTEPTKEKEIPVEVKDKDGKTVAKKSYTPKAKQAKEQELER